MPPVFDELSQSLLGMPFEKKGDIDDDLATCETNIADCTKNASEILQQLDEPQDLNGEDETEADDTTSNPTVSREEALTNLSVLRSFFIKIAT